MSSLEDLEKLSSLKEKGVITAEEFEEQKKAILANQGKTPVVNSQAKSRVAYILLAIFLGGFGIHNFYAGYTGKAVAQLLITLLIGWLLIPLIAVFIWTIVDMVTVDKDADGVPFV